MSDDEEPHQLALSYVRQIKAVVVKINKNAEGSIISEGFEVFSQVDDYSYLLKYNFSF